MNKFILIQSLRLDRLQEEINAFADHQMIQSVSVFENQGRFIASVVYTPAKYKEIEKEEFKLILSDVTVFVEFDGCRAVTKRKRFSVGEGGGISEPQEAVAQLIEKIGESYKVNVKGSFQDVKVIQYAR